MKTSPKKAVIIIENDIGEFNSIKDILSGDYPNDKQKYNDNDTFENFRLILQNALSVTNTERDEPERSKKLLFDKLRSYCGKNEEPVYIIDFLLEERYHSSINGIHFHKLIHQELYKNKRVPSFFITVADRTRMAMVQDYCEKEINDKELCHFKPKPDEWDDVSFKNDIIDFIKKAQSKPQSEQKNEPVKVGDLFEYE